MIDGWSHWLFVGLFGVWVLAMLVCAGVCWAHSRQHKREHYEQPHHVHVVNEYEPYDWARDRDAVYDWEDHEVTVQEEWLSQWT